MKIRLIYLIALQLILASCSIHKVDIQQGNILTRAVVQQVKPGMSHKQVQFLLGNPAIQDPFNHNRWDYPFRFQSGKKGTPLQHYHVTVFFDGDSVTRVEANMPETDIPLPKGSSDDPIQDSRSLESDTD